MKRTHTVLSTLSGLTPATILLSRMLCVLGWAALHTDLDHLLFTVFLASSYRARLLLHIWISLAWPSGVRCKPSEA
jgi:hypothetical protein